MTLFHHGGNALGGESRVEQTLHQIGIRLRLVGVVFSLDKIGYAGFLDDLKPVALFEFEQLMCRGDFSIYLQLVYQGLMIASHQRELLGQQEIRNKLRVVLEFRLCGKVFAPELAEVAALEAAKRIHESETLCLLGQRVGKHGIQRVGSARVFVIEHLFGGVFV